VAEGLTMNERRGLVEWQDSSLSVVAQARLLGLHRSGLYYQPRPPSALEVAIRHRIDEIYTALPFYGSRRIAAQLKQEGFETCRETVRQYMQEMGLSAIYPQPHLSRPNPAHKVYPYLLRNITASYPNHIWGIDITYIRLVAGWLYLVAVIDWYSRYVISWQLDDSLALPFVLRVIDQALEQATPDICNSDQGSQFTHPAFTQRLLDASARISMDGRGRALDNIFTERLWRSVKYEEVYLQNYQTPRQARLGLTNYFHFYNHERLHQSLGYRTPATLYLPATPPIAGPVATINC
jgi:putative transposase